MGKKFTRINLCEWILVTGATSGIGWKLVEHLVDLKKGVICLGRSQDKLNELKNMIEKKGHKKYILVN